MLDFAKTVPSAARGFGLNQTKYMSGRTSASVSQHGGLGEIRYFGNQPIGAALFFKADVGGGFDKLFRLQLMIEDRAYYLTFEDTKHYPFAYQSFFTAEDVRVRHELVILEDALVQRIVTMENPGGRAVSARLLFNEYSQVHNSRRTWSGFTIEPEAGNSLCTSVRDQAPPVPKEAHWSLTQGSGKEPQLDGENFIAISCDRNMKVRSANRGFKYYMTATEPAENTAFFVLFGHDQKSHSERLEVLKQSVHNECDQRFSLFNLQLAEQPRIETGAALLDSALGNAVPAVLNLRVADTPGAIRASQDYWVWGWDSLVHADALLLSGHSHVIKDMLYFYRETASPDKGIIHALNTNFEPYHYMEFGAQCLFITVLYNYWVATGDLDTLNDLYPFACWILSQARKTADERTGLTTGTSFYPDFPEYLDQDRDDISVINNSLFYQAVRALTMISEALEECDFADKLEALSSTIRSSMEALLFNSDHGYWRDSISSKDLSPREHFPLYAIFGVSPFAYELGAKSIEKTADFMWKNFPFSHGLYMLPTWDTSFMEDGNQLGSYYPGVDRYFWNLMNHSGNVLALPRYQQIVTHYWQKHTYPEAQCHETVNADVEIDNPGCKQAFTAKSWYCDYIELTTGISMDSRGISFQPLGTTDGVIINGLRLRGKHINLRISGKGRYPMLCLNGRKLDGYSRISWNQLEVENTLDITMEMTSASPVVVRANEIDILQSVSQNGGLDLKVSLPRQGMMVLLSSAKPVAYLDGAPLEIAYFRDMKVVQLEIPAGEHQLVLC